MKLIIEIPEKDYQKIHSGEKIIELSCNIAYEIANGIPLEQIRDEIRQTVDEEQKHDGKWAIGLRYAVKIIDKYKGEQP